MTIDGLSSTEAQRAADRWCGEVTTSGVLVDSGVYRLTLPPRSTRPAGSAPRKVRIGSQVSEDGGSLELRVGPHAVVIRAGAKRDAVRFSAREAPSRLEVDFLIDLGVNHLLALQGLPVLHSCCFELGDSSILGLGGSFSGKTTVSVAAIRSGGRVVSDDVVMVVPDPRGKRSLLPVRSYGWLRGRTREIVPDMLSDNMRENEENGQPRWMLNREDCGAGFVNRATPNVIWVQSVDRRLYRSRIEPINHGRVFAALIRASSPLFLSRHCPEIRDKLIQVFRELCAQCRGYRVRLGRRLLEDPEGDIARLVELAV